MSVDSIFSHIAWQKYEIGSVPFPLASDYWPHGAVAKSFGILRDGPPIPGINERAVFVVNKQGKVTYARLYELGEVPDIEEVLESLRGLE